MTIRKRLFHALESAHMQSINARLNALEAVCEAAVREAVLAERGRISVELQRRAHNFEEQKAIEDRTMPFNSHAYHIADAAFHALKAAAAAIRKGPENDG